MWLSRLARRLVVFVLTLLAIGFAGATLVRVAPGFGIDERELDTRLTSQSIESVRNSSAAERDIAKYYLHYIGAILTGDLGYSRTLGRPIRELFAERIPTTLATVGIGLAGGWTLGLIAAIAAAFSRSRIGDLFLATLSGLFQCLPSAVLALFFLYMGGPAGLAVALIVFPKVFHYTRNLLVEAYGKPHVLAARSRGLSEPRVFCWHVLPRVAPQLLALAGVSVTLAFSATIPVEVVCDSPGIGQLAWHAATARDVPLLTNITLVVALVTLIANSGSAPRVSQ